MRTMLWLGLVGLVTGCGSGSSSNNPQNPNTPGTPTGPSISIQNMSFSPVDLTVDAGTVIAIFNHDTMAHTVTSEASDNAFTPGSPDGGVAFDTGQVPGGTTNPPPYNPGGGYLVSGVTGGFSITIPASTPSGTVIPYYCQNHTGTMTTPNGHITVR
jgi:plastocyanin